jgi:hypothetical protein
VLSIVGRAREGTNSLAALYESFIRNVRNRLPPQAALSEQLAPSGSKFNVDLSAFAGPEQPAPTEAPK